MIGVFLTIRHGGNWEIIINRSHFYTFKTRPELLVSQFSSVLHYIQKIIEKDFGKSKAVIWSTDLPNFVVSSLHYAFPNFSLVTVRHSGLRSRFHEIFARSVFDVSEIRPVKSNTLYICSDASASTEKGFCTWGWASSEGAYSKYGYGLTKNAMTSAAELEGICQAIVANKDTEFENIHVYSDCLAETERINDYFNSRTPEIAILDFPKDVQKIAQKALAVQKSRNVSVSWVKGHKGHRLNEAADFISGKVRKEVVSGKTDPNREEIFKTLKYFTA